MAGLVPGVRHFVYFIGSVTDPACPSVGPLVIGWSVGMSVCHNILSKHLFHSAQHLPPGPEAREHPAGPGRSRQNRRLWALKRVRPT